MAKAKTKAEVPEHTCRDCSHSHSEYNTGWEGAPIMALCNKKKHSVLLRHGACREFQRKPLTITP
jgi:hypothetical protein